MRYLVVSLVGAVDVDDTDPIGPLVELWIGEERAERIDDDDFNITFGYPDEPMSEAAVLRVVPDKKWRWPSRTPRG